MQGRGRFAIIHCMKRLLLAVLLCSSLATGHSFASSGSEGSSIQAKSDLGAAISENPVKGLGLFQRYPFYEISDTPPPDGYSPFYISHYGRHGCRYLSNVRELESVDLLEAAAAAGELTDEGLELLKRVRRIKEAHNGMIGSLSVRGAEEHRRISRRMHDRFPQVFSGKGKVMCQSSTYPRCIVSMSNFACELKGLVPQLDFDFVTGDKYLEVILNRRRAEGTLSMDSVSAARKLLETSLDPSSMIDRFFRDGRSARKIVNDPYAFGQSLFYLAGSCNTLDAELGGLEIFSLLSKEDILSLSRAMNGRWYINMGNSVEFGDAVVSAAGKLANDFAKRADEAIGGNGVVADLRFGHDSGLWPFAGYIGLEGVGDRVSYLRVHEHKELWKCMTMAANLQMVFYRNGSGDVLVKVLFNERETRVLGIDPASGPYYRWSDVKSRLVHGQK